MVCLYTSLCSFEETNKFLLDLYSKVKLVASWIPKDTHEGSYRLKLCISSKRDGGTDL